MNRTSFAFAVVFAFGSLAPASAQTQLRAVVAPSSAGRAIAAPAASGANGLGAFAVPPALAPAPAMMAPMRGDAAVAIGVSPNSGAVAVAESAARPTAAAPRETSAERGARAMAFAGEVSMRLGGTKAAENVPVAEAQAPALSAAIRSASSRRNPAAGGAPRRARGARGQASMGALAVASLLIGAALVAVGASMSTILFANLVWIVLLLLTGAFPPKN